MYIKFPEFMSSYRTWVVSSLASAIGLVRFFPHLSIRHSYTLTALAVFSLYWVVYGIYSVIIWPRFISPLRHLPGPAGGSFFNGQWSVLVAEPSGIPPRRWANEIPNDGLIHYLHMFNKPRVLVTNSKALAEVLVTKSYDFVKPNLIRAGIGKILGIGILFAEGDEHKAQRKNLMPAFNFRHVKQLYPIFWSKSREMVHAIQAEMKASSESKPSIEVGEWGSRATLDIIGVAGLGKDFEALKSPDNELNRVYRTVFQPDRTAQIVGLLSIFLPSIIVQNLPLSRNNKVGAASKVARTTCRDLIAEKRRRLANKEPMHPDIISVALESGGFSDDDLVNNMMTFLAAGHETTASAFMWAAYLLCQHQDVQKKLREEIHTHIPSLSSDKVDHEVLDNMPYLHAFCQEVLRIYSPVPLTLRQAACDTTIQGHFIPKDTTVILAPWATNHNVEMWGEDASEFKPDRWMAPGQANAGGAVSNYAFLTFLHGPRSCIGMKFAQAEFAALIAAFVGAFELELVDPEEQLVIKGGITAKPRNGINVYLNKVGDWGM